MKEETQEEADQRFANEEELRFWQSTYEIASIAMMQSKDYTTFADMCMRASTFANSSVEERRKFIQMQQSRQMAKSEK